MDHKDGKKRVGVKGSSKVDWLSNLPESLLCKVLLNLPTKDVVRTSVLSKRWRNLWKYVPGFDLSDVDFPDPETFISFVNAFLGFNHESYLESFKLNLFEFKFDYVPEKGLVRRWINTVVDRRVKHLHVWHFSPVSWNIEMPPNFYICESLVSLKLCEVAWDSSKFVSLPSLKVMDLSIPHFANDLEIEKLISGCPVLESLKIKRSIFDRIGVLRVCSQSLLSFTHVCGGFIILVPSTKDDTVIEINAPKLQYLRFNDYPVASFILNDTSSLVEVDIDTAFSTHSVKYFDPNDLQRRKMFGSFLEGISCVKDMTIGSKTLEVIYHYSKCEQLPLFHNLSFLRVSIFNFRWKMMPIFLESCPNLKSLVVASDTDQEKKGPSILSGPRCLLSFLEFVDIETPLRSNKREMKLVSYFLEKSTILNKLTIRLDASMNKEESETISKELLAIPRLSTSCQVIVL